MTTLEFVTWLWVILPATAIVLMAVAALLATWE